MTQQPAPHRPSITARVIWALRDVFAGGQAMTDNVYRYY